VAHASKKTFNSIHSEPSSALDDPVHGKAQGKAERDGRERVQRTFSKGQGHHIPKGEERRPGLIGAGKRKFFLQHLLTNLAVSEGGGTRSIRRLTLARRD